jgi:ATP-binding cassette subfamily F protein uup
MKSIKSEDEEAYKAFDGMDQHNAWDFENTIQANFVQIEVGKFQTEVKKSFGWTEKKIVSCILFSS